MTDGSITKDIVCKALAPDDFKSMIGLDRSNAAAIRIAVE